MQSNLPLNYKYYLCGSAEMVVDVRDILIAKGIPYEQIFAEIYF
jgi:ferredoxin--NADP+ reductase